MQTPKNLISFVCSTRSQVKPNVFWIIYLPVKIKQPRIVPYKTSAIMHPSVFFRCFVLLCCFPLASACSVSKNRTAQPITRKWMLIQLPGFTRDQLIAAHAQIDWQDLPATAVKGGCYTATYQTEIRSRGRVRFSKLSVTTAACDTLSHQLADTLTQTMPQITTYRISGHHLTLFINDTFFILAVAADWD